MKVCTDACLFGAWLAAEIRNDDPARLLDIGAGTGLLSLMVAQQTSGLIDAVEADETAFIQASENVAASPFRDRIKMHYSRIQDFDPGYRYEIVFSNPPFYDTDLRSPDSKRNMAMHGTGLSIDQLMVDIERLLTASGKAAIIIPYRRMKEVQQKALAKGMNIAEQVLVSQSENHAPFRCMYLFERGFVPRNERKITVRDEEFNSLLETYYL